MSDRASHVGWDDKDLVSPVTNKRSSLFTLCILHLSISSQVTADDFELSVAEEILRLEQSSSELKAPLQDLYITAAKEVDCGANKAIVIYVPFKLNKAFRAIQQRLVRELEKKFSGAHVLIIAQRTILGKTYARSVKTQGVRPRSRTLTAVQDAILEDIVYPTEIEGKRTRCKVDGSKILKVYLSSKDQANIEGRTSSYASVYNKLTNKNVSFHFV
jgi:small subunit ribosomal protein S7e